MNDQRDRLAGDEAAARWARHDPDPDTRRELERLIAERELAELSSCMTPLTFGTAGLRGVEGPGPGRMNLAVVVRMARGVGDYLLERSAGLGAPLVVIGHDARKHSQRYAEAAALVLAALGLQVRYFETPTATPLVAYAANVLSAAAALCVTASHNPKQYAGVKLYAENAVQIVTPADERIALAIERVGPADELLKAARSSKLAGGRRIAIGGELIERYYLDVLALRVRPARDSGLRIVYTPLHGVGGAPMTELLARAGYASVSPVPEQFEPDPEFPTLHFPNPEEPGTLKLALAFARREQADLLLANDPDADRLAVAVPSARGFRVLTGNQVGLLLADYLLAHQTGSERPLVVSSIVSSPMLRRIAAAHGADAVVTLTGFKWLLNAALALERERGIRFVFGYEEALGYAVSGPVRDKDGLSAGLLFADLVDDARQNGRTIADVLAGLYQTHGLWASALTSLSFDGTQERQEQARTQLERFRAAPPLRVGGLRVENVTDYTQQADARPWYLAHADLLEFELEGGARVLLRPSGTESKLKIYADFAEEYRTDASLAKQEALAQTRAEQLARSLAAALTAV